MEEGKKVVWRFPEYDINVAGKVGRIICDEYIAYVWDGVDKKEHLVEIKNDRGRKRLHQNSN